MSHLTSTSANHPGPASCDAWEADVVVVGGGLAGHCAALEAVAGGATCLLLEKQSEIGGSTVLSGGFFALAGTDEQAELGIEDSPELLLADLWKVSGERADHLLLRTYADEQLSLYQWLTVRGATFSEPVSSSGQSVARSHRTDPRQLLDGLANEARREGVGTRTDVRVTRLLRDAEQSRVTGCRAVVGGAEVDVTARRAVVLCTGGFVHGADLLDVFAPQQRESLAIGGAGNVGDGLRMAWALGADVRDMGYVKGTFGTHPRATTPSHHEILLTFYKGAIVVNAEGERFVDESISYKDIGEACRIQPQSRAVQVFDAEVAAACNKGIPLFDVRDALRKGLLVVSDDLEDLARQVSVDPDGLRRNVERYNDDVRHRQVDSVLGRSSLCHGAGALVEICTPPFYAYPSATALLATYCGVRVSADTQVVDVWNAAIPGLFAAGEIVGGFHGAAYMTGSSLGKAALFGRIAGRQAATFS